MFYWKTCCFNRILINDEARQSKNYTTYNLIKILIFSWKKFSDSKEKPQKSWSIHKKFSFEFCLLKSTARDKLRILISFKRVEDLFKTLKKISTISHLEPNFNLRLSQSQRLCQLRSFRSWKISLNRESSLQLEHLSVTESRPTPLLSTARSILGLFDAHLIVWR